MNPTFTTRTDWPLNLQPQACWVSQRNYVYLYLCGPFLAAFLSSQSSSLTTTDAPPTSKLGLNAAPTYFLPQQALSLFRTKEEGRFALSFTWKPIFSLCGLSRVGDATSDYIFDRFDWLYANPQKRGGMVSSQSWGRSGMYTGSQTEGEQATLLTTAAPCHWVHFRLR